jgi:hypothetical protein
MNRREFIGRVGLAAAAAPLVARHRHRPAGHHYSGGDAGIHADQNFLAGGS